MVSKSANYCCTSKTNNTGLMLLCEVALGNCWEKYQADYYASNLPPNMNSTKGVGRTAPHKGETIEGAWAPCEKV
jgi:poly [ADP-ribose] polymerase